MGSNLFMHRLANIFTTAFLLLFLWSCTEPIKQLSLKKKELLSWELPTVPDIVHPRFHVNPSPVVEQVITQNPPIFQFPPNSNRENSTLRLRYSTTPEFTPETTQLVDNLPFVFYNPHEALIPGNWYWQYSYDSLAWSERYQFQIDSGVPIKESPTAEAIIRSVPRNHPRSLVMAANLFNLRKRNEGTEDTRRVIQEADRSLQLPLPTERLGLSQGQGNSPSEAQQLAEEASIRLGETVKMGIEPLVQAYLLTAERRYARAALAWAREVVRWDPRGVSGLSEVGNSHCMLQLAYVYDVCYIFLTEEERETLLSNIEIRGNLLYNKWRYQLDATAYSSDPWELTLTHLLNVSLATLYELPDAKKWLTYVYECWVARSPILGASDGGWGNGISYFKKNSHSLLELPMVFQSLTGVDFLTSSFYDNNPLWLSHARSNHPKNMDDMELQLAAYADALGRLKGNAFASQWADELLRKKVAQLEDDKTFRWFRLRWELPEAPSKKEGIQTSLAQVFSHTGEAYLYAGKEDKDQSLSLSLRASPYGSIGGAAANQNSFSIQYGAEPIFTPPVYTAIQDPKEPRNTKAHNTFLIDGKGQAVESGESFAWISRFLHGEQISYVCGDASKSYDNVQESPQQAGLTSFKRHLVFARPNLIIVYDELAADHDAQWEGIFHSPQPIRQDPDMGQLLCESASAQARINIFASGPLAISIDTAMTSDSENYRSLEHSSGKTTLLENSWHIHAKTRGNTARFLTLIQVVDKKSQQALEDLPANLGEGIQIGDWSVSAEMDPLKPASFLIQKLDQPLGIGYNKEQVKLVGGSYRPTYRGSTLLVEKIGANLYQEEAIDEFPE